jgi:hypothetical protein
MEHLLKNLEWALKAAQDYGSEHIDDMTSHQVGMVYAYRYGVLKNAVENAISDINFALEMSGKKPCKSEE